MIHEKLHGTNSGSLPELQTKKSSFKKYNERSVDEAPLPTPRVSVQHNVPTPVGSISSSAQNSEPFAQNSASVARTDAPPAAQRSFPIAQNGFEHLEEEITVFEFVRGLSVLEARENAPVDAFHEETEKPLKISPSSIQEPPAPTEDFQKRVKFEKVNEIQETFYEVQVDEAFGESSTDEPFGDQKASSPEEMPPPTPMKRKSRENISQHVSEEISQNSGELSQKSDVVKNNEPVFERVSSEYKFAKSEAQDSSENDPIVVEIPFDETSTAEVDKTEVDGAFGKIPDTELPIAAELNAVLETMPPHVKPRTKKMVQRTSDVGKTEEINHEQETPKKLPPEKPERAQVVSFAQKDLEVQPKLPEEAPKTEVETFKTSPNFEPTEEFFVSNKFSENYENFTHQDFRSDSDDSDASFVDRVSPPIENSHIVPKSILKTSETAGVQKTITFHNVPDSSSSESFFSDEEQDVWSQVDQQRFHLSRNRMADSPPPLPKTPPPSVEEESRFSYA